MNEIDVTTRIWEHRRRVRAAEVSAWQLQATRAAPASPRRPTRARRTVGGWVMAAGAWIAGCRAALPAEAVADTLADALPRPPASAGSRLGRPAR